ncbi:MAG: YIP1 family protein [Bdellovibrionales bacterium]|nr:YIP1 family protein [Bdellovibrionales bacterium]
MGDGAEKMEFRSEQGQTSQKPGHSPEGFSIDFVKDRALAILKDPKGVWSQIILQENPDPKSLYQNYLIPLAALPVIASYLGMVFIGVSVPLSNITLKWGVGSGLGIAVTMYLSYLLMPAVVAFCIEKLAPRFQSSISFARALQLVVYAMTASLVGGIFSIIPALGFVGMLFGLYSFYTFFQGFGVMTEVPQERKNGFFAVSIILSIVAGALIQLVIAALSPSPGAQIITPNNENMKLNIGGISIDTKELEDTAKILGKVTGQQ